MALFWVWMKQKNHLLWVKKNVCRGAAIPVVFQTNNLFGQILIEHVYRQKFSCHQNEGSKCTGMCRNKDNIIWGTRWGRNDNGRSRASVRVFCRIRFFQRITVSDSIVWLVERFHGCLLQGVHKIMVGQITYSGWCPRVREGIGH